MKENITKFQALKWLFIRTIYLVFSNLVIGYSIRFLFRGNLFMPVINLIVGYFIILFAVLTIFGFETGILSSLVRGSEINFKAIKGLKSYFDFKRIKKTFAYFIHRSSTTVALAWVFILGMLVAKLIRILA